MNVQTSYVPELDPDNISPWHLAIDCRGQALGIPTPINNLKYQPEQFQHRPVAALTGAIHASLHKKCCSEMITSDTVINPVILIENVYNHIYKTNATDQHIFGMD